MQTTSERAAVMEDMDPSAVRLTGSWVVVRRERTAEKVGSLYVPDSVRKPTPRGVVVNMGPDAVAEARMRLPEAESIAVGDHVWTHSHSFVEARMSWQGGVYDIVKAEDIVAFQRGEGA